MNRQRTCGRLTTLALAALALMTTAVASPRARADIFTTPSGSTAGGLPVDATATFTVSAGQVTITLTNLEANPTSDIQTVNGVAFVLSSGQTTGSLSSQESIQRIITGTNNGYNDNGTTPTSPVGTVSGFSTWNVNDNVSVGSGHGVEVTSIGNTGGKPTLIGGPDGLGNYSSANGSITNSAHQKFLAGTETIVLNVAGVNADSKITAMQFEFGTMAGTDIPGVPPRSVPEPTSSILAGLGALGFIAYRWKRRVTNG